MINRREKDVDRLDPKTEGTFQSEDELDEAHFYKFDWPNILAKVNAPSNDNPISYREFTLSYHYASVRDHARVKAVYMKQSSSKSTNASTSGTKKISKPGDAVEVEAEQITKQVMEKKSNSASENTSQKQSSYQYGSYENQTHTSDGFPLVVRAEDITRKPEENTMIQESGSSLETNASFEEQLAAAESGGAALDGFLLAQLEQELGVSLGHVRIHTDSAADALARGIGALAFTSGNHIYFQQGKFAPLSNEGYALLVHELVHAGVQSVDGVQLQVDPQTKKGIYTIITYAKNATVLVDETYLYHDDSTSSEKIVKLKKGQTIRLLQQSALWYFAETSDQSADGYILASKLKIEDPNVAVNYHPSRDISAVTPSPDGFTPAQAIYCDYLEVIYQLPHETAVKLTKERGTTAHLLYTGQKEGVVIDVKKGVNTPVTVGIDRYLDNLLYGSPDANKDRSLMRKILLEGPADKDEKKGKEAYTNEDYRLMNDRVRGLLNAPGLDELYTRFLAKNKQFDLDFQKLDVANTKSQEVNFNQISATRVGQKTQTVTDHPIKKPFNPQALDPNFQHLENISQNVSKYPELGFLKKPDDIDAVTYENYQIQYKGQQPTSIPTYQGMIGLVIDDLRKEKSYDEQLLALLTRELKEYVENHYLKVSGVTYQPDVYIASLEYQKALLLETDAYDEIRVYQEAYKQFYQIASNLVNTSPKRFEIERMNAEFIVADDEYADYLYGDYWDRIIALNQSAFDEMRADFPDILYTRDIYIRQTKNAGQLPDSFIVKRHGTKDNQFEELSNAINSVDKQIDVAESSLIDAVSSGKYSSPIPVSAIIITDEHQLPVPLRLFLTKTSGRIWRIIDLTNPEDDEFYDAGSAVSDEQNADGVRSAWMRFVADNRHPSGELLIELPPNLVASGSERILRGDSDGKNWKADFADWLSNASSFAGIAGLVLMLIPGGQVAGGILLTASAIAGGTGGALSMYTRYERGNLKLDRETFFNVSDIAAALTLGTLSALKSIKTGINIARVNKAMILAEGLDKANDAATAVMLGSVYMAEIEKIKAKHLPEDKEKEEIEAVLHQAALVGGLMLIGYAGNIKKMFSKNPHVEVHGDATTHGDSHVHEHGERSQTDLIADQEKKIDALNEEADQVRKELDELWNESTHVPNTGRVYSSLIPISPEMMLKIYKVCRKYIRIVTKSGKMTWLHLKIFLENKKLVKYVTDQKIKEICDTIMMEGYSEETKKMVRDYLDTFPNSKFSEEDLAYLIEREKYTIGPTGRLNAPKDVKIDHHSDYDPNGIDETYNKSDLDDDTIAELDRLKAERDKYRTERDKHKGNKDSEDYLKNDVQVKRTSESMAEAAADGYMKKTFGDKAKKVYPKTNKRSGRNDVDQVWEVDGKYYVIEAKGGSSTLGTRKVEIEGTTKTAEQGSRAYLEGTIAAMKNSGDADKVAIAEILEKQLEAENIIYLHVQQPINTKTGDLKPMEVKQFDIKPKE